MSNHYLLMYAIVSLDVCISEITRHIENSIGDDLHEGELKATESIKRDLMILYNKYADERDKKEIGDE